jgi:hypothetical protein
MWLRELMEIKKKVKKKKFLKKKNNKFIIVKIPIFDLKKLCFYL